MSRILAIITLIIAVLLVLAALNYNPEIPTNLL